MKFELSPSAFDAVHLALMMAALGLAYLLPFQLVILAYAVLGPVHYLTEISWLHERSFFLPKRALAGLLAVLTGMVLLMPTYSLMALWLWLAVAVSAFAVLAAGKWMQVCVVACGAVAGIWLVRNDPAAAIFAILLPTLIHVSLFTLVFMLVGALRSRSLTQIGLVGAYLASLALILAVPPESGIGHRQMESLAADYFGNVGEAFGRLFDRDAWPLDARLGGLLSFAYTYHYLNWFIKVKIIKWHTVSKKRLLAIALLSLSATGLYYFNYALGFAVLIGLSLLHVVLELPLNLISLRQLATAMKGLRPAAPR